MSENSKIEWTDHTSKAGQPCVGVRHPMALLAKRLAVVEVEPSVRVVGKRENVMCFQIASPVVAAALIRARLSADITEPFATMRE